MKKPLHMLTGVNVVDYGYDPATFMDRVKKFKFGKENGSLFNFLTVRMDIARPTTAQLYEWAEYFRDNGIYFKLSGSVPRMGEQIPKLTREENEKMQDIAGEYYLGEGIGEFGGWYATKAKGYYAKGMSENPVEGLKNCKEAKETYIRQIGKEIDVRRNNGARIVSSTEAVALFGYDLEAGVDEAVAEVAPRNMDQLMSFARGAVRTYKNGLFGAWLAHEFYGGYDQFDPLKAKRFTMEYYSMYLAGVDYCCLESGFHELHSHLDEMLPEDHPLTRSYLNEAERFAEFCNKDIRPGTDGPITKIAFVQGNYDGYAMGGNSSLWGQYYDEKWGFSAPEHSYMILDEVYKSLDWTDNKNLGDYDYSTAPAYGMYDVIPATAPLDVLKRYDYIIFCGWNSMTPEIAENFKKYTEGGGNLFITAAHMRDSVDRDKRGRFCDFDWESFLGVKLSEDVFRTNDGYKFVKYSTLDGMAYPGTKTLMTDPAWSSGYTDYVKIEPTSATPVCYIADSFGRKQNSQGYMTGDKFNIIPIITENKVGSGNVIFMASSEYPGAPAIYPLYKMMVKAILAASHRISDLKVIGSDKLRFAMYEGEDSYKLYILNSDYNQKQFVTVFFRGERVDRLIDIVGLEIIEFKK